VFAARGRWEERISATTIDRIDVSLVLLTVAILLPECTLSASTMDPDAPIANEPQPSIFRWIIGFLMVGACWGLTTPFMRKAAM
jgi:hypothetical protein